MTRVTLNDGTELAVLWCGVADRVLSMQTGAPMSIREAVDLMTEKRMVHVIHHYGEMEDVFDGFTEMINANVDPYDGRITVSFRKAVRE